MRERDAPSEPLVKVEEIMFAHTVLIRRYGGSLGVRDASLVESALARPVASFEGWPVFSTPAERAAALWVGLIRNHGFVDGNKRTAAMAMRLWLEREGWELPSEHDDAVYERCIAIANKQVDIPELAAWLGRAVLARRRPGR